MMQWFFAKNMQGSDPDAMKAQWQAEQMAALEAGTYKPKEITADFEPLPGWRPFADMDSLGGAPAMLAQIARSGNLWGVVPTDWFDLEFSGYGTLRYQIADIDHYLGDANTAHHYTCIPESLWPNFNVYDPTSGTIYADSYLNDYCDTTIFNSLDTATQNSILETTIHYAGFVTSYFYKTSCKIYVPSEFEMFGQAVFSLETGGEVDPPNKLFKYLFESGTGESESRVRNQPSGSTSDAYFLRSGHKRYSNYTVGVISNTGKAAELYSLNSNHYVLPMFNLG